MMTCWDRPRYPAFGNYISRLRSSAHKSWPHPKRSPSSFSAAGFFYTGKVLCVSTAELHIYYYLFVLHYTVRYICIISLQGTLRPAVSIAVEGLGDGWGTMTRGKSTSSGSRTVSTFDTIWRGRSNALDLPMMMIAPCRRINALLCSLLVCNDNTNKIWLC